MSTDHAQSPRLGQPTPVESTVVRMFTGEDLPEVAWDGQMIYRTDTQILQVYVAEDDAWSDVVEGVAGLLTFVGEDVPLSVNAGDLWFRVVPNEPRAMYRATGVGDNEIAEGEWVLVLSDLTQIDPSIISSGTIDTGAEPLVMGSRLVLEGEMELIGRIEASGLGIVGMSGADGFYVLGEVPAGGTEENRKLLISFPVNGDPNIIAGQLTATTALVTDGLSVRGESGIETGSTLVLHGEIRAPKNAPVLSPTWDMSTYDVWDLEGRIWVQSFASDGISLVGSQYQGSAYGFYTWDIATGSLGTETAWFTAPWSGYKMVGITYNAFRDVYHTLWQGPNSGSSYRVMTFEPDLETSIQNFTTAFVPFDYFSNPIAIGVDLDTGDVLLSGSFTGTDVALVAFHTDANGLLLTTASYTVTLANTDGAVQQAFIGAGNFDYGSKRYVSKAKITRQWETNAHRDTSGVAATSNVRWSASDNHNVFGAYWNPVLSKFQSVALVGGVTHVFTYEGGESIDTSGGSWVDVGYTFYDDVGTAHETDMSPISVVTQSSFARAKMRASMDAVPTVPGDDSPTKIRVWMNNAVSATPIPPSSLFLRDTTTETALVIWPGTDGADFATAKAADFEASAAAEIQSADNGSYWKGDNTAKFNQMLLTSTTDANISTGNLPPLRTGDPAGKHIRYGTEEIIAMLDDDTVGTLILNRGGVSVAAYGNGTFKVGAGGREMNALQTGGGSIDTNASGNGTWNHGFNFNGGYALLLTSRDNGVFRYFTVITKNPNNAVIRVNNHDGSTANSVNGMSFDYICIGL